MKRVLNGTKHYNKPQIDMVRIYSQRTNLQPNNIQMTQVFVTIQYGSCTQLNITSNSNNNNNNNPLALQPYRALADRAAAAGQRS